MTLARNSNGINGFVLAGGKSSRMGFDKAQLIWRGRPLVDHMIELLSTSADTVRVIGRPPLPDRIPGQGPLGGIQTALVVSETDANLVVALDLPHLTPEFLKYVRVRLENTQSTIVACRIESRFPLCLGLRRAILPEIDRRMTSADRSIHGLIAAVEAEIISESDLHKGNFSLTMFRNLNTPADVEM